MVGLDPRGLLPIAVLEAQRPRQQFAVSRICLESDALRGQSYHPVKDTRFLLVVLSFAKPAAVANLDFSAIAFS